MSTPSIRSIDQILGLADDGMYLPDLLGRFEAANIEMRQFAQDFSKSKVTLALTVSLSIDRHGQVNIEIDDKIKTSTPPKRKSVAWLNGDGALSAENPAQMRSSRAPPKAARANCAPPPSNHQPKENY